MNIDIIDNNVSDKLNKISESILSLTIDEFFALKQILIKKNPAFDDSNKKNISSNSQNTKEVVSEKSESFEIVLEKISDAPAVKAQVIVALTKILKLPLMQARNAIDSLPFVLMKGIKNQEEFENFKNQHFKNIDVTLSLKKEN